MYRLTVKRYLAIAPQYWHRTKLKSKLVILYVLICVATILCPFRVEQMDSPGTTGHFLACLDGKVCNRTKKCICGGTRISNMVNEDDIVVSVDTETRQNWTLCDVKNRYKGHKTKNTLQFAYPSLVLEANEWGITPSASNRTNSRFLMYNRVPKCASSMLLGLLHFLRLSNIFKYYQSGRHWEQQLTIQQEKEFLECPTNDERRKPDLRMRRMRRNATKNANFCFRQQSPFAMDRHMYFINMEAHDVEKGKKDHFTAIKNKYVNIICIDFHIFF